MQQIVPSLWFDGDAEEAAHFYVSVFKDGRILSLSRYPEGTPEGIGTPGQVLTVEWEVQGMRFCGINGGPQFSFTEAVSFQVACADQAEIDHYWDRLTEDGGEPGQCGWLKDRYGLSWQVVPAGMDEVLGDPERAPAAFTAMLGMTKIDLAALQAAGRA